MIGLFGKKSSKQVIPHSSHHVWFKDLPTGDILECSSKKTRYRLRKTLKEIDKVEVTTDIAPLSDAFFSWFTPIYKENIGKKKNARMHDVYDQTLGNKESKYPYYTLTLNEGGIPTGGTIFSVRDDRVSIAYRTYPNKWSGMQLSASPSIYTEYLISKHAQELGKEKISHGLDRNPYGPNASIGLAYFKLQIGCYPHLPKNCELHEFDSNKLREDTLLLVAPKEGGRIREAILFIESGKEEEYAHLLKYPEQLEITIIKH